MYKPFSHIFFTLLFSLPLGEGRGGAFAQENLVPNPSFEDTTHCPIGFGDFGVFGWYSPTWGSPDLLHECYSGPEEFSAGVPQNVFGWQWPRTGSAYVGFHFSAFEFGSNTREYIQCELVEQLNEDSQYVVEFFISRADSSKKACHFGAFLSETPVSSTDTGLFSYQPQVVIPQDQIIIDTGGWTRVSDTVVAAGGERYLTIGLFTNDDDTYWIETEGGNRDEPYYYIDDVSVVQIVDNISIPDVFTPNGDSVNDVLEIIYSGYVSGKMIVYDRWGRCVFNSSGDILEWDGQINGSDAHAGVYYLLIEMNTMNGKRIIEKGFVHLLR